MTYRCVQCDFVTSGSGNCPLCGIPMEEVLNQAGGEPGSTPEGQPAPQAPSSGEPGAAPQAPEAPTSPSPAPSAPPPAPSPEAPQEPADGGNMPPAGDNA